jgi:hypothetical protein
VTHGSHKPHGASASPSRHACLQVPRACWDPSIQIDGCQTPWYEEQPLSSLNLSCNCLKQLPSELEQCIALQLLNASSNELASLPDSLSSMTALKLVDVSSNSLSCGVDAVSSIPNLAKLVLSDNPLRQLPPSLGARQAILADVTADRCMLEVLPEGLAQARGLRSLSCNGNQLSSVDAGTLAGAPPSCAHDLMLHAWLHWRQHSCSCIACMQNSCHRSAARSAAGAASDACCTVAHPQRWAIMMTQHAQPLRRHV